MQLFGVPYQFLESVDPRVSDVSDTVGAHFTKNILFDAPVLSIIPGEPRYIAKDRVDAVTKVMDSVSKKVGFLTNAAAQFASSKAGTGQNSTTDTGKVRYYDFRENYAEYVRYVNNLCRACAMLLEIGDEQLINCFGEPQDKLKSYNWAEYHWNGSSRFNLSGKRNAAGNSYTEAYEYIQKIANGIKSPEVRKEYLDTAMANLNSNFGLTPEEGAAKITKDASGRYVISSDNFTTTSAGTSNLNFDYEGVKKQGLLEEIGQAFTNYTETSIVQFYIDADTDVSETFTNQSGDSFIKSSLLDSGSSLFKELAFIAGSAGAGEEASKVQDTMNELIDAAGKSISEGLGTKDGLVGTAGTVTGRILDMLQSCANGETIIMPKIYQQSDITRSFSCTIHLKCPYGSKTAYYMDIVVPLMHILALCLPRQATANSYRAPFLVKAYIDGAYSCNLGLVSGVTIKRSPTDSSFTVDGFPTEVDVTLEIEDLYSDLSVSATEDPALFIENASLIDYLSMTCGLALYTPNIAAKLGTFSNTLVNAVTDIPDVIGGRAVGELADLLNVWGTTLGA